MNLSINKKKSMFLVAWLLVLSTSLAQANDAVEKESTKVTTGTVASPEPAPTIKNTRPPSAVTGAPVRGFPGRQNEK